MNYKTLMKQRLPDEVIQCAEILVVDSSNTPIGFRTLDIFESVPECILPGDTFKGVHLAYRKNLREYAATFIFSSDGNHRMHEPIPAHLETTLKTRPESIITHENTRVVQPGEAYYKRCRRIIGSDPLFTLATGGFITDGRRVLLQKRTDNGLWGITGGGLEIGEDVGSGACREAREETGLKVEVDRLLSINTERACFITYPNGDQLRFVAFLYRLRAIGGSLHIDGVETDDLEWFPIDALPDSRDPYLERHAKDFFNDHVVIH